MRGSWRERVDATTTQAAALCVIPGPAGAELSREVDLGAFADAIEDGRQTFVIAATARIRDTRGAAATATPSGAARTVVEYLDAQTGTVLERWDSG